MDLRIVNKSEKESEIYIDDVIGWDESSWIGIKKQLTAIADSKVTKIVVNINSPGGYVSDGLMIHDALKMSKATIETRVFSMTASAATIIAQAGDVRKMSSNSLYLIHHAMMGIGGNVNDVKQGLDDLEKVDARILDIYLKGKGAKEDKIKELFEENNGNGKWIDAEEALEAGLIDEIFEPAKAVAMVLPSNEFLAKHNLPEIPKDFLTKINKMEEIAKVEDKSILDKMEDLFNRFFPKKEEVEKTEDIKTEAVIEDVVSDEVTNKEILAAKDVEIEALKKSLQEKEEKLNDVEKDLAMAYTKLGQLDAASTIVVGSEGNLDVDDKTEDVLFADDIKKLNAHLNKPVSGKRVKDPEKDIN